MVQGELFVLFFKISANSSGYPEDIRNPELFNSEPGNRYGVSSIKSKKLGCNITTYQENIKKIRMELY
jgi:hypothetical protein